MTTSLTTTDTQNVQLSHGIVDNKKDIYVTQIYWLSDSIKRGNGLHDYKYAIITRDEIFTVFFEGNGSDKMENISTNRRHKDMDVIKQAIVFDLINSERDFEKSIMKTNPSFSLYKYNNNLKRQYLNM